MIYDYRNRIVYNGEKKVRLTELEGRLLMLLSDNEIYETKEIKKYLYNTVKYTDLYTPYILMYRLKKKLNKIDICLKNRFKIGYCIEEEIYLTDSNKLSKRKLSMKERKYLYRLFREKVEVHEERKDK